MKIKTTMSYNLIPTKMVIIKKMDGAAHNGTYQQSQLLRLRQEFYATLGNTAKLHVKNKKDEQQQVLARM
jgi:hypothetical protein